MPRKKATDTDSSLLVIKLDDTPSQRTKSPPRKRRRAFGSVSKANSKQRRTCYETSYESPLIHLGRINLQNSLLASLDESVVLLDELTNLPTLDDSVLSVDEKDRSVCPDDGVIVLSDNENESRRGTDVTQTSQKVVLDRHLMPPEITTIKEVAGKKNIRARTNVDTKATKHGVKTRKKGCSSSTRANSSGPLSISIDLEDENTVFDDRSSKTLPQVEIISVDNTPVAVDENPSLSTLSKAPIIDEETKNDETRQYSMESSGRPVTIGGDVSVVWTAAKQLTSLGSAQKHSKCNERSSFRIDTNGDSSGLLCLNGNSRKGHKIRLGNRDLQNPNWAMFVTKGSSESSLAKEQTIPTNQPGLNGIRSYYTEETVVRGPGSLRDIVIDGCNIAMAYTNNKCFSEAGLKLVIDYFKLRGHTVKAFIPHHKRSAKHTLLEKLHTEGIVVFTPSRVIGGRRIVSYDDRYILDYATMCDGIVVSLDQYRDLYTEKPEWRNTIENRLLVPTFVGKCVMFPEDPLGRCGPKLEEFLRH